MRKRLVTVILLMLFAALSFTASFAWFADKSITDLGITSYVHKSYFESGDGTSALQYVGNEEEFDYDSEGCAFEIKHPVQFHSFAWLQALGYFNQTTDGETINQVYFYLSADLDMTGWVLPQIGTEVYPFVGNFDGNGHTISNVTVQNVKTSGGDTWQDRPVETVAGLNIVGVFGVVGSLENDGTVNAAREEHGDFVPTSGYTYSSLVSEVKNCVIEDATIKTDLSNSLVGIAAGYVNGKMENVKVVGGTIQNVSATTALTTYTTNLSDFGAVGYVTNTYKGTNNVITVRVYDPQVLTSGGGGSGQQGGNNWGNSVDMLSMYEYLREVYTDNDNTQVITYGSVTITHYPDGTITEAYSGNGTGVSLSVGNYPIRISEVDDDGNVIASYSLVERNDTDNFVYLYGESTRGTYTQAVTDVYVKNAFYVYHDNDVSHNFSFLNNAFTDATRQNATKWVIEDDENDAYVIYTIIGANKYYFVNDDGDTSYVTAGVNAAVPNGVTRWTVTEDTISDGNFCLCYRDGAWKLVLIDRLLITDDFEENAKHYLTVSNGQVANAGSKESSVSWSKVMASEDAEEKDFYLYTTIDGHDYYLKNNEGTLALEVDPITPSTKWRYEAAKEKVKSKVYTVINEEGDGYALYYDDTEGIRNWSLTDFSEVLAPSGSGNSFGDSINMLTIYNRLSAAYDGAMANPVEYVSGETVTAVLDAQGNIVSSSSVTETSEDLTTIINYEDSIGSYSFARHPSGTKQYLYLYGEDDIGESDFSMGYLVAVNNGYRITDGNGNYFYWNNNRVNNTRTANNATTFTLTNGRLRLSTNTSNYLSFVSGTATVSTTQSTWDTSEFIRYGNYYLIFADGEWYLRLLKKTTTINTLTGNSFYIQSSDGNYYTVDGRPAVWTFSTLSGSGTVSTYVDGVQQYLGRSGNQLTLSASSYTWNIDGSHIYDNDYYISYNNGWVLSQRSTYYLISYNGNYLNAETNGVSNQTSVNQATRWTLSNTNANTNTRISTVINGTTYYLYINQSGGIFGIGATYTLTTNTSSQNWRRSGTATGTLQNRSYTSYYAGFNNGAWTAVNNTNYTLTYTTVSEGQNSMLIFSQSIEAGVSYSTVGFQTNPTYLPLSIDDGTGEINKRNTGYIAGGSLLGTSGYDMPGQYSRGDIRVSYYAIENNISDSTNGTGTNRQLVTTKIRTIDGGGDKLLSDQYVADNFKKYSSDEDNEGSLAKMNAVLLGQSNVYGLHFMNAAISQSNTTIVTNAKINGKTYASFELPNDSIDFTLKERGYINFFAGTYFTGNDSFFSLHKIERADDGTLVSIKEILEIYGHGNDPYIYKLKSSNGTVTYESWEYYPSGAVKHHATYTAGEVTAAGYTLLFDTAWIKKQNSLTTNAVYYFEIPADQGEYALGSVDGGTGAYLMYLDIGAAGTALKPEGNAKLEEWTYENLTVLHSTAGTVDYSVSGGTRNADIRTNPTFYPLAFENDTVANGNTGYVISGANNEASPPGDIRVSRYTKYASGNWASIRNSLTSADNAGILNNSNVYTVVNGVEQTITAYGIGNQYTQNYQNVQEAVNGLLSGTQYVYGLHFMQSTISSSRLVTVPKAVLCGETYYNYAMPQDCVDFMVAERGRITFMAGTYFSGSRVNSFFSLHRIFRDNSQNITDIKELSEIYGNGLSDLYIYRYVGDNNYYYSNGTEGVALPNGYELIFDTSVIRSNNANLRMNSVYYFEIPVDAGEFALGSAAGDGAYLLYLDIAANAGFSMKTTITEVYETTVYDLLYPKGVAFVDDTDSVAFDTDGKADPEKSVFMSVPISNSDGGTEFVIDENGNMTVENDTSSLSGYEAKSIVPGGSLKVNNGEKIEFLGRVILTEKVSEIVSDQNGRTVTTVTTTVQTIENGAVTGTTVTRTVTTTLGDNSTTVDADPPVYDGHTLVPTDYTLDTPATARTILLLTYRGEGLSYSMTRSGNLNYIPTDNQVTIGNTDYDVFEVVKQTDPDENVVYGGTYNITITGTAGTYPVSIDAVDADFVFTLNGNALSVGSPTTIIVPAPQT